ncbi:ATP-dependent DNA helicase PIF1 [Tanacetum coccineum]
MLVVASRINKENDLLVLGFFKTDQIPKRRYVRSVSFNQTSPAVQLKHLKAIGRMLKSLSVSRNELELMLNQLELGATGTIVVMICRMWDVNSSTGRYLSTDFIVSDKEGYLMHCTARGNIAYNFLLLKEGTVYSVSHFSVQPNKEDFRVMRFADFMLEFDGDTRVRKSSIKSEGFNRYPFQFVKIDDLEPTNNKYLIDVVGYVTNVGRIAQQKTGSTTLDFHLANRRGQQIRVTLWGALGHKLIEKRTRHIGLYPIVITAVSVKLYNNRLYLSSTSSSLIIDDEKIPVLRRLKHDDSSGLELTKEVLPGDNTLPKPRTLENLLMWARNRKYDSATFHCDVKIDKIRTKNGWNFPSCGGEKLDYPVLRYRLELEISDHTAEVVVVLFDETATSLLKCSASAMVASQAQDEDENTGLPAALANIVGTSQTLELKSHTYYEHQNYESFTCWRIVTADVVEGGSNSDMVAAKADSKAPGVGSLNKSPLLSTPSKPTEEKKHRREKLEDSDADESFVADSQPKGVVVECSSDTKKKRRQVDSNQSFCGLKLSDIHTPYTATPAKGDAHTKRKEIADIPEQPFPQTAPRTTGRKARKPAALSSAGTEISYHSLGAPSYECHNCNATMWYEERNNKGKRSANPTFSLCCQEGKVLLPRFIETPEPLRRLLDYTEPGTSRFRDQIRVYNGMFCFTSFGARIDHSINVGRGLYTFRINGHNYHRIGSLLPQEGTQPRYAQLWFFDTQNELRNRLNAFVDNETGDSVDGTIVGSLIEMLDRSSAIAQAFRMARDWCHSHSSVNVELRLLSERTSSRQYNAPTIAEVAALITNDFGDGDPTRDIIVNTKDGQPKRISELHTSYMALQYPLLFPYGEDGYHDKIPYHRNTGTRKTNRDYVTMKEYYAYVIQYRQNQGSTLHRGGRLFQQYLVDAYTAIEEQRLSWTRNNQDTLRVDLYHNVCDAITRGDTNAVGLGKRIVLPHTFIGGPRYMMQNYQDAMALCRAYGNPDLFITFTSNPKWPEINEILTHVPGQRAHDRPEVGTRVFKLKITELLEDITKNKIFGESRAVIYVIEFQKRGLPHAHILLWLEDHYKCRTPEEIDDIISAELPSPTDDPTGYKAVTDYMLHGPCGKDARYVVPHNRYLLLKYQAHINVEWCNRSKAIKYLFKYLNKGPDRATIVIQENVPNGQADTTEKVTVVDEIKNYLNCRYLAPCEAVWRMLSFDIHYSYPSVMKLNFHLPNQQPVTLRDSDNLPALLEREGINVTMFTDWFALNELYPPARARTYAEIPQYYVWGPRNFEELLTVNKRVCSTFKEACFAYGLLNDDREWTRAIQEASVWALGPQLRDLFVTILLFCDVSRPLKLWEETWEVLSEDILHQKRKLYKYPELQLTAEQIQNYCLVEIQEVLNRNGRSLAEFQDLPRPNPKLLTNMDNRLIREALEFDMNKSKIEHQQLHSQLNPEQHLIYEQVVESVHNKKGNFYFVYGPGGTGKTFLYKTIIARLRSERKIVLAVASSGIASLLLPAGRTAHSRFVIPLELLENSTCGIKQNTHLAELMQEVELIIWDEAPMTQKYAFEALDKTLRDILGYPTPSNRNKIFGGLTMLLGGDFRQILPVIPKGKRSDIVQACINRSELWKHCKVFTLTRSMRVHEYYANGELDTRKQDFNQWVLAIGDGKLPAKMKDGEDEPTWIQIPEKFLINASDSPIAQIVAETYPNFIERQKDDAYLKERAILTPRNDDADAINAYMFDKLEGESITYNSADEICKASTDTLDQQHLYPVEFLNTLNFPGMPPHALKLKKELPIMLLRNVNPSKGLCNGTCLIITELGEFVLKEKILTGSHVGYTVLIHRIILTSPSTQSKWPFILKRRQYPVRPCYVMTINKSQVQSLNYVGLYLPNPVFSHGQLYVTLSRVTNPDGLKILMTEDDDKELKNCTRNIVYKEVFGCLT